MIPKLQLAPTRTPPPTTLAEVHANMLTLRGEVEGIRSDMIGRIEKLEAQFHRLSNLLITLVSREVGTEGALEVTAAGSQQATAATDGDGELGE